MVYENKDVGVLLVEDDEVDQMAVKRAFKQLGITNPLIVANDGIEALDCLQKMNGGELQRPFVILLDLNMPRMDGIEFMEKIREDDDLKNIVVFVMTTSRDSQDLKKAYSLNAAGYIVKNTLGKGFTNAIDMVRHYWKVVELPA